MLLNIVKNILLHFLGFCQSKMLIKNFVINVRLLIYIAHGIG